MGCHMFYNASRFTSDLSEWDTRNVADMSGMFHGASSFNSDLSKWQTGNLWDMEGMFDSAVALQQRPLWYTRWEEEDHDLDDDNDDGRWWIEGPLQARGGDFQLCTDDCIFADFVKQDSAVKLLQISFDGYGCCDCTNVDMMDENDAKELLAWVN